jgi:hypothetical protein
MLLLRKAVKSLPALLLAGLTVFALVLSGPATQTQASSHREAPLIGQDPVADATDLYAFVSPERPDTVTFIANYIPFEVPAAGPNFYRFGEDVQYAINIDNVGDAHSHISYQFHFYSVLVNGNTFLYNTGTFGKSDDGQYNYRQYYSVTRVDDKGSTVLGTDIPVAAANVGPKSIPDYTSITNDAVAKGALANGVQVFAGPRADPFFADIGALFDLLTIRKLPGNMGGGVNDFAGFNVHSIALQVPRSQLTHDGSAGADPANTNSIIGVWTTASRQATKVLTPARYTNSGDWVQVSRLGNPLVNEVVVPLAAKDLWNSSQPMSDTQFLAGVQDPEPARLLNLLYGIKVPATPRNDLVTVFLTGIPGVNQPANVTPSEELRLNMGIPVTPSDKVNSLGVAAGDAQGWPNGRRLGDDVIDVALKAVAGGYVLTPDTATLSPNKDLGDGVDSAQVAPTGTFPYSATPYRGYDQQPHP